ncbi:testis-expressed protein 33 [Calypte anna]|nr:testis-expressed protein 33 [Calypte anna]
MDEVREVVTEEALPLAKSWGVLEYPTSPSPDENEYVLASSSVEPEEEKKEDLGESLCPSSQKTSQKNPSKTSWKTSRGSVAQGTEKNSTFIKSQVPLSSQCVQIKKQSKHSLKAKTPSIQSLHSRRLEERERRTLSETALIMGQKRIDDRTKMIKNPLDSPQSFADYNHLGYNLRSNIFQGGPLETRSLMKDSYTPDIIQKAIRDPKNWHGRRTDELGKWHQKNALNLSVQKALEERYGKKQSKP